MRQRGVVEQARPKLASAWRGGEANFPGRDIVILIFLGVAAILITLPLVVASLLPKWPIPACLVVLAIIAVAAVWEFPLLAMVDPRAPREVGYLLFTLNAFTVAWILVFALAVRLCGYSPTRATQPPPVQPKAKQPAAGESGLNVELNVLLNGNDFEPSAPSAPSLNALSGTWDVRNGRCVLISTA